MVENEESGTRQGQETTAACAFCLKSMSTDYSIVLIGAVVMLKVGSGMMPYTLGQIDDADACMVGSSVGCVNIIYRPICPLWS